MRMNGITTALWQVVAPVRPGSGQVRAYLGSLVVVLLLGLSLAFADVPAEAGLRIGAPAGYGSAGEGLPSVSDLVDRAERARQLWARVEDHYESEVAPLERVLLRYRADPELAQRIALALVREGAAVGVDPRVLLAVMLVENPMLDPAARSPVGARGLMQVMPFHRGKWPPCEPELDSVEGNICHGARIFAHNLEASGGDVERALLRYNGCVRGTNTPNCHEYPYWVFARAGRASIQAWVRPTVPVGAAP